MIIHLNQIKETLVIDRNVMMTIRELYGIETDPSKAVDALQEKVGNIVFLFMRDSIKPI